MTTLHLTRRALLMMAGAGAAAFRAHGQYVLPPQNPPAERFPPTPEQAGEIARRVGALQDRLTALRNANVADELLVEAEIFHKAAVWITRFNEYFGKDAAAKTLALLDTGLARAAELQAGKSSWTTATGPVIRAYRSRVDGSAQPYIAYVPASYSPRLPGRMDVILHGTNRGMVEVQFLGHIEMSAGGMRVPMTGFLQIELLGRTNNAYRWAGETDVLEAVSAARRSYAVDENRVVLRGFSMGGSGTWHLGLHYPDHWAAIEPGAGFNETIRYAHVPNLPAHQHKALHIYDSKDYALNLSQLPAAAYTGEDDPQIANLANIRDELAKSGITFTRDGLNWVTHDLQMVMLVGPKTGHRWEPECRKQAGAFIDQAAARGRSEPDHIRFVTHTTRYNRCFWVTLDGLERHYERAEVDARRSPDGSLTVQTKNVSALLLTSPAAKPAAKNVVLDGHTFTMSQPTAAFQKRAGVWREGLDKTLRKRHGLQGPVDDAFLDSFLCVRPTGQAANDLAGRFAQETLDAFTEDYAKYFRGQVRVKDDTAVSSADIADHHLILFGDPSANQVLKRALTGLPLRWDEQQLSFRGKSFDAGTHTIAMIYPNPLDQRRYVVLNTGHSFRKAEMAATNAALFPRFGDYAVLHLRQPLGTPVEAEVTTAGFFDEEWQPA